MYGGCILKNASIKETKYEQNLPTLTDTSLPLNQSIRLAQERGAVGRSWVLVGDRRRIRTIRFHKFFSTLCRWLQTYVMVAIV